MPSCVMWHILMVAVGNANALRKHHSQESGHALMHGEQLKQQAFKQKRKLKHYKQQRMAWRRSLPYKGGREDPTTFPKISSTRQHFSSIRQHFLKFLRLDNISRRFGNLFLFPVKLKMSSTRQKCRVDDISRNLLDSTTFPFWREN